MAVKDGNTVRVHYTGTFSDGEVFERRSKPPYSVLRTATL